MASIINAATSGGLVTSADTSGVLQLQTASTTAVTVDASQNVGIATTSPEQKLDVVGAINLRNSGRRGTFEIDSSGNLWMGTATTAGNLYFETGHSGGSLPSTGTERVKINQYGIGLGGATPSSGMGITFPADQTILGASSNANTLDDYEEGTFTPSQGTGLTVVGTFSSSGRYTKIGNLVTVNFRLDGTTSVACSSTGQLTANLPFSVAASPGNAMGSCMSSNNTFTGAYAFTTEVYAGTTALAATGAILATITYQV